MSKFSTDHRDKRSGAYDPIDQDGLPQPHQVKDRTTQHEAAQPGADVRADALPGTAPVLPEGLVREPQPPLNPALDGALPSDSYASPAHCKKKVEGNAGGSQPRKALAARQ
jgi:hypothetical protein